MEKIEYISPVIEVRFTYGVTKQGPHINIDGVKHTPDGDIVIPMKELGMVLTEAMKLMFGALVPDPTQPKIIVPQAGARVN